MWLHGQNNIKEKYFCTSDLTVSLILTPKAESDISKGIEYVNLLLTEHPAGQIFSGRILRNSVLAYQV